MANEVNALVSTEWLEHNLSLPKLRILDASWYLPSHGRDPETEFFEKHIHGSKYFDIEKFSDPKKQFPHMVPSLEQFCSELSKLGVGEGNHVVVYDGLGLFSAARAWWLFKLFGFQRVSVLDGGLPKWVSEKKPVTSESELQTALHFTPSFNKRLVCDWRVVKDVMINNASQIVDARPRDRFKGLVSEPRPGLKSGHIPGSINVCYKDLLNADQTMKSIKDLRNIFESQGLNLGLPIVTSCGSGVTAAILSLALNIIGVHDVALYDGSWAEWGMRSDLDVATSE
jgi:thiosulfate/3-mercaptopyruvate sulfurtransferase